MSYVRRWMTNTFRLFSRTRSSGLLWRGNYVTNITVALIADVVVIAVVITVVNTSDDGVCVTGSFDGGLVRFLLRCHIVLMLLFRLRIVSGKITHAVSECEQLFDADL